MGLKLEGERIVEMPVAPLVYMTPHMASIYKSGMHRQTDISYSQGLEELFKGYDGAGENPTERRAEGIRYLIEHYGLDGINAELAWQAFIDWKWPAIKIRLEEEKSVVEKAGQPDQENLEALYGKYGPYYSGKAILAAVQLLKAGEFARAADEFEKARNGFEPKKNPQEYKVLEEWRAYAESQAGGRKSLADDDLEAVGELEAVAKDMVANFSYTN